MSYLYVEYLLSFKESQQEKIKKKISLAIISDVNKSKKTKQLLGF
jgi:hypothetical protein